MSAHLFQLTKLKVKELTSEIPHLPISDQVSAPHALVTFVKGREQSVLDNLKNTLMQAKEVLKEARLSSNSGGVFMNALLDRAEEAERKEKEAREKALVLEEEVARLSSSSYSNFPDSTGDDELDVLVEKAHMEARIRELLKQLADTKEAGRDARRQLEEKDKELREKDRRVKELEEGATGKREKAKSIEQSTPKGEVKPHTPPLLTTNRRCPNRNTRSFKGSTRAPSKRPPSGSSSTSSPRKGRRAQLTPTRRSLGGSRRRRGGRGRRREGRGTRR